MSDALANFYALMRLPGQVDARAWRDSYAAIAQPAPQGQQSKVDEAGYAAMSARDRLFYCRGFDQRQFDHTGGRRR
jgi:hypothetical protein